MTFAGMITIEYKTGGPSGMNREKSRYKGVVMLTLSTLPEHSVS